MSFARYDTTRPAATAHPGSPTGFLLLTAVQQGDAAAAHALVTETGADVQHRNAVGENAAHIAARRGFVSLLDVLLRHGADPNVATVPRCGAVTPLHYAVRGDQPGRMQVVRLLLQANADPNVPDATGKLPLHDAVLKRDAAMCELLCAHGTRADAKDALGMTPVAYAVRQNYTDIAELVATAAARGAGPEAVEEALAAPTAVTASPAQYMQKVQERARQALQWHTTAGPPKKKK